MKSDGRGWHFDRLSDRQDSGADLFHCAEHGHRKMGYREVRGRVMWLTHSFGDRVEHGERPQTVA